MTQHLSHYPTSGLYDPAAEHDSCGVAFVATLRGTPGRDIVDAGLTALRNLDHRGAVGAEENTGDGAGILTQIPDEFLRAVFQAECGVELPPVGEYAVGIAFYPTQADLRPITDASNYLASNTAAVAEGFDADANLDGTSLVPAHRHGDGHLPQLATTESDIAVNPDNNVLDSEVTLAANDVGAWWESPLNRPVHLSDGSLNHTKTFHYNFIDERLAQIAADEGLAVLAHRDVPVDPSALGPTARATMPTFRQVVLVDPAGQLAGIALDRRAYRVRKRAQKELELYFASLSCRTLVHKGMLTTNQLQPFFKDLSDPRFQSQIALVHSRFSTNTFPSWPLAQPMRLLAHNGEINTVRGNRNWMAAREGTLQAPLLGDLGELLPICTPGASDSASFDEVLELLHLAGRSLPHAVLMMIPEAWEHNDEMDVQRKAFYDYHLNLIEPWDGPAALTFTDGTLIGAVLDRNGLRPARYWVTDDGLVVLASETGVLDIPPAEIVRKGRLEPGRMFLVDTAAGRIIEDAEIKAELASAKPYQEWIAKYEIPLESLPKREHIEHSSSSVGRRQRAFGYTREELQLILTPMANTAAEPLGAMGNDTPIAVLSDRPRLLFDYFTQMFAQVTNPPLDAIREELVTSLGSAIGPEPNILEDFPEHARKVILQFPIIDNDQLAQIVHIARDERLEGVFRSHTIRGLYPVAGGGDALRKRLRQIWAEVDAAIDMGATQIILSDRHSDAQFAPIPSLLLTASVHHHLLRQHSRTRISLIVEAGDVREVHHAALLIGYGAACINPYLAMETVEDLAKRGYLKVTPEQAVKNLIYALGKGVLKVMSKMGISTIMSYRGAQTFEAVGLSQAVVDTHFTGTTSRLGGVGLDVIAAEVAARHARAYPQSGTPYQQPIEDGGEYQWRRSGPEHLFDPESVFWLQQATRAGSMELFRKFSDRVDDAAKRLLTVRGLLSFEPDRQPVPIAEVESVSSIVKRFSTGAMSFGSISREAHETLALAMNAIGARSNTGEGGERPARLYDPSLRSRVKQVASGRFGVTSEYLTHADDIQIKLAQGAKPGEGGQLPHAKVYPWVAEVRHSTPGVGLISPPPHHDIYSIEDLAQLIYDLKNANPTARIHVKLVSEFGVGTVAAGVSKARADVVLISGHDGGTGAAPLTSLKHAGTPWEIGLAETQQTLVLNNLRDRITVQVDGQLRTGRDVVIAALLGAEEFGFAQAPMVAMGCVMMRVCHLDTCPTGIATQNPELRKNFTGKPEYVINYFELVAQQVREILASLGFRSLDEAVGQNQVLNKQSLLAHWKASSLDLTPILQGVTPAAGAALHHIKDQEHGLAKALDNKLIEVAAPALAAVSRETSPSVTGDFAIRNVNRSVGTMLGYEVSRKFGGAGLPPGTIDFTFTGSAGQSFGAFLPSGITLRLIGDANDYLGKGLSGGIIAVRPDPSAAFEPAKNVVAGNVIAYGATSGEIYLRGVVGERFGVRNSGATLVAEAVGDHACEYMTGGTVVVLGPTGRNFGAGMSGGTAYVLDLPPTRINPELLSGATPSVVALSSIAAGSVGGNAAAGGVLGGAGVDGGVAGGVLGGVAGDQDWAELAAILKKHVELTGSTVAAGLLSDPDAAKQRFTRIQPAGWAKIRQELASARAAGNAMAEDDWNQELWVDMLNKAHGTNATSGLKVSPENKRSGELAGQKPELAALSTTPTTASESWVRDDAELPVNSEREPV